MKKKTLVWIGIAVCIILLVFPVLASAGYSKIYGNANEDEVLDMRDVTYLKLVIFGKKPATTFADANYDGKISMLDIGQTKLIILGKEKQLTLVDQADRRVTINRPVERVASLVPGVTRVVIPVAGGIDNLVGVSNFVPTLGRANFIYVQAYPELLELPGIGWSGQENMELIVSIKPDIQSKELQVFPRYPFR
jgi:iron complex transport system substrate-binding protein